MDEAETLPERARREREPPLITNGLVQVAFRLDNRRLIDLADDECGAQLSEAIVNSSRSTS